MVWAFCFVLFWMSAHQFVGQSVPFPSQELLGQMILSLLADAGWKEVLWGTLPPACVMTGRACQCRAFLAPGALGAGPVADFKALGAAVPAAW